LALQAVAPRSDPKRIKARRTEDVVIFVSP
jgi:hypothetical protein